ncbi:MAG: RteC domain-containing protein [Mucilaginibacter sp.]|nr:RteC domain-containing protein [Mucilaginibacter sp.]
MNDFEQKLYNDLLEELAVYADLGAPPIRRLTGALAAIGEALVKLKAYVAEHPFRSVAEEIRFFKFVKPAFMAERIYAMEIFHIESSRPLNDLTDLNAFYIQELKHAQRYLEQQRFLYAYFQADMKELDNLLFIRGARPADIPLPDVIDLDPGFGTSGDKLFAKFRAFERLQKYLHVKLKPVLETPGPSLKLIGKWPGEQTDLVELGYALYAWLRVRNVKVTAVQVTGWLEESLGLKVGRPHQRLSEIKMRKLLSRTRFLDELREVLNTYMQEGDAWEPGN